MKKKTTIITLLTWIICIACLSGCGKKEIAMDSVASFSEGGVLILSVNPEIAIEYNQDGVVIGVSARNEDALEIISRCKGLIGEETREVVTKLVTAIGEAGYFVEEVEGGARQITIEIEAGSQMPHEEFLEEVVSDVQACVNTNNWNVPTELENESNYDISDYGISEFDAEESSITDENNTDYEEVIVIPQKSESGESDYTAPAETPEPSIEGNSDYSENDYATGDSDDAAPIATPAPVLDGNSAYDGESAYDAETDYDSESVYDAETDYDSVSVYDAETDYDNESVYDAETDYDNESVYDAETDYDNESDYDDSDYGDSDYDD